MQITITAPVQGHQVDTVNGYVTIITDAPQLTGTDKQIAWADAIRTAAINDTANHLLHTTMFDSNAATRDAKSALKDARFRSAEWSSALDGANAKLAQITGILAAVTSAKAWIEAADAQKSMTTIMALVRAARA